MLGRSGSSHMLVPTYRGFRFRILYLQWPGYLDPPGLLFADSKPIRLRAQFRQFFVCRGVCCQISAGLRA